MRQVRLGVFKTNSSSTHSLTMVSQEIFKKWEKGEYLFYDESLVSKKEVLEELKKENKNVDFENEKEVKDLLERYDYKTYEEFMEWGELEKFEKTHTTPSGDVVVAFGEYGYDS